jgi:putative endopeptidase
MRRLVATPDDLVVSEDKSKSQSLNFGSRDRRRQRSTWWTCADADQFAARVAMVGRQLDKPYPGLHVKGDLTMGEKIDDLSGGVNMDAWYQAFTVKPKKAFLSAVPT